jgi:hypothetical protein
LTATKEYIFIETKDDTARLINDWANHLYQKLAVLDLSDTDIDENGRQYFHNHHGGHRLFFSIQSSAAIIDAAVKKHGRKIEETSFMDYGAGLGTLFLLAGLMGFKQVYFNDYFPQWAQYAKTICDKLGITMTGYISGDIDAVIDHVKLHNITIDIIASRNVVEHIYSLRDFYGKLYNSGITSLCYATTTANLHNPAMRIKHHVYHRKVENNLYKKQREDRILELKSRIESADLSNLVKLTRGRAFGDFTHAIDLYCSNQAVPKVEFLRTNTCDCRTGVWAENLISRKNYFDIITNAGFKATYTAGFWDTHYKFKFVNLITRVLNGIIKLAGKKGYWFAPFVNITASKK